MLYLFPPGTTATVIADYDRPYPDPIAVRAGDVVVPDVARSRETDILGWTWCVGPDGRGGWTPTAWMARGADGLWRMVRDFSALEHTLRRGDRAVLHHAESGSRATASSPPSWRASPAAASRGPTPSTAACTRSPRRWRRR